jgi:hypothetical protein
MRLFRNSYFAIAAFLIIFSVIVFAQVPIQVSGPGGPGGPGGQGGRIGGPGSPTADGSRAVTDGGIKVAG